MQWSLFVLILMGQCSLVTCQLYEYHFVNKSETWDDAKEYCRKEHTDLATVYDMEDMERLRASTENEDEAWIGLYNIRGGNRTWHWSLPGVEHYADEDQWDENEPNNANPSEPPENCVAIVKDKLQDHNCQKLKTFICYNDTHLHNIKYHFINTSMNWTEAQNYCREHHTDLISGLSQLEEAQDLINNHTEKFQQGDPDKTLWIGLFRDTWRWANGSTSSFRNWRDSENEQSNKTCATVSKESYKWGSDECNKTKPFFCYEDKVILIKENKTWEEALNYCRENHYDLVSIINPVQQIYVQEKAKKADSPHVWLGLRYTCTLGFWFWISDEVVDYKNWNGTETNSCDHSGAMDREGKHKWFKKPDQEKFNFICSMC